MKPIQGLFIETFYQTSAVHCETETSWQTSSEFSHPKYKDHEANQKQLGKANHGKQGL